MTPATTLLVTSPSLIGAEKHFHQLKEQVHRTLNRQRQLCFARHHLSISAVAFHDYMRAVSKQSGVFYRDDRRDAAEFGVSYNKIRRIFKEILTAGFVEVISQKRRSNGSARYVSGRYNVLDHEEWAARHPGRCRTPHAVVPDSKTEPGPDSIMEHEDSKIASGPDSKMEKARLQNGVEEENIDREDLEKGGRRERQLEKNDLPAPHSHISSGQAKAAVGCDPKAYIAWLLDEYDGLSFNHWQRNDLVEIARRNNLDDLKIATRWLLDDLNPKNTFDQCEKRLVGSLADYVVKARRYRLRQEKQEALDVEQKAELRQQAKEKLALTLNAEEEEIEETLS